MFLAYCFRQRTYVARGSINRAPNETQIQSSSLIVCYIHMAFCHMFSDESNKL